MIYDMLIVHKSVTASYKHSLCPDIFIIKLENDTDCPVAAVEQIDFKIKKSQDFQRLNVRRIKNFCLVHLIKHQAAVHPEKLIVVKKLSNIISEKLGHIRVINIL